MSESALPRAEILRTRDLVGWTVSDANGGKVGTVDEVLIDRGGRVRFLAVTTGLFRKSVLLPVDALDWGEAALVLPRWGADDVKALPAYHADRPLTAELLEEMERAHPRLYGGRTAGDDGAGRVIPLAEARDFRLGKGAPDPRGWNVFGADGERAGVVAGLLVDPLAMKVAYFSVDLADDLFGLDEDRHVLVPAPAVDLRERGKDAWVAGLSARDLARLPAYTGGAVDPLVRRLTDEAFANAGSADAGSMDGEASGERSLGGGSSDEAAGALGPGERIEHPAPPHVPPTRGDFPGDAGETRMA